MKMALCIYGQPRTMEFCFPSVKEHILDVYHPDVFVAADSQGDRIKELYNPVAMKIYSQEEEWKLIGDRRTKYGVSVPFPEFPQFPIRPPEDLSYLFKGWKCSELLREYEILHEKYDVVVGTRFDAKYLKIQRITVPKKDYLYLPSIDACHSVPDSRFYASHLWWSSSATALAILNGYNWSDVCYQELGRWCGEMMLKWFCDKNGIKVKRTDVTFMLIRDGGGNPHVYLDGRFLPISATHYPEYLLESKSLVPHRSFSPAPSFHYELPKPIVVESIHRKGMAERWAQKQSEKRRK